MSKRRYYVAGDGKSYPLREAMVPFNFKVYRKDCKSAIVGDPSNCLIAKGARRHKNIDAVYIGSGKDAYVVMNDGRGGKPFAVHYTINAAAAKVRDEFDRNKNMAAKEVVLSVPTAGRTLDHRSMLGKKRRKAIKAGAEIKKRDKPSVTRVQRIGMKHRPRANIDRNLVSLQTHDTVQ